LADVYSIVGRFIEVNSGYKFHSNNVIVTMTLISPVLALLLLLLLLLN
jgi:hypothetical protein